MKRLTAMLLTLILLMTALVLPVQAESLPTRGAASSWFFWRAISLALRMASRTFAALAAFSMIFWAKA